MAQYPPSEYVPTSGQGQATPPQAMPPPPMTPPQQQFLPPVAPLEPVAAPQPVAPLEPATPLQPQNGQPVAPAFPGGGAEAPYRDYTPPNRKVNWTLFIVGGIGLLLAIPALYAFIGVFTWASGMSR